jgi:rare lipoprotein A
MAVMLPYYRRIAASTRPAPQKAGSGILAVTTRSCAMRMNLTRIFLGGVVLSFSISMIAAPGVAAETGIASIYSTESGTGTASGQKLNPNALTAAHKKLPFGTKVRVTNKKNGKSIVVTINDRGPFIRGRIIDLTPAGGRALGFSGLAPVTVEIEG